MRKLDSKGGITCPLRQGGKEKEEKKEEEEQEEEDATKTTGGREEQMRRDILRVFAILPQNVCFFPLAFATLASENVIPNLE